MVAVALGVLAGAVVVGLGRAPGATPAPVVPDRSPATPLVSPRRVPGAVVDAAGAQRLGGELDAIVGRTGGSGCYAVTPGAGGAAPVSAARATEGMIPASTLKLLTAAAVLEVLGPDRRLTTEVVAGEAPDGDGSVPRLFLVGGGDPLLSTPDGAARREAEPWTRGQPTTSLATLADRLVRAGVRSVPGGIAADDSRHDTLRWLPSWPSRYGTDIGPLGALTVDGGRPGGTGAPVDDPALLAASELRALLAARGVQVGPVSRGTAPRGAPVVASVGSASMTRVVGEMLAASDNLAAEMLTREMAVHDRRPGTTAEGVAVTRRTLARLGVPVDGLVMVDGSGLSRENRVTCDQLSATLALSARPRTAALAAGLAVAGERGTLVARFRGTPLEGRLRAKTGTLAGVAGLAGVVDGARPVRFSLLLNGPFPDAAGAAARDDMALAIGRWPDVPGGPSLVPAPG